MDTNNRASVNMVPITIRLTPEAYNAIKQIATDNHLSMAQTLRYAIDRNMEDYLSRIRYLDTEQGREIEKQITTLFDEVSRIKYELRRIGINYNQEIKLKQIREKYQARMKNSVFDMKLKLAEQQAKEEKQLMQEMHGLDIDELNRLMDRFEAISEQVSKTLWAVME